MSYKSTQKVLKSAQNKIAKITINKAKLICNIVVRLPSTPLDAAETNCRPTAQIAVFRNVFSVIVPTKTKDVPQKPAKLTLGLLQKWIEDNHGVKISKSSITQVKSKCGIQKLEFGARCASVPALKTEKERPVLEALKHYGLV